MNMSNSLSAGRIARGAVSTFLIAVALLSFGAFVSVFAGETGWGWWSLLIIPAIVAVVVPIIWLIAGLLHHLNERTAERRLGSEKRWDIEHRTNGGEVF